MRTHSLFICYKAEVAKLLYLSTQFLFSQAASLSNSAAAMKLSNLPQLSIALAFLLPHASCSVGTTDIVTICSTYFGTVSKSTIRSTTYYLTIDQCATATSTRTPYVTVQPTPQTITSTTTQFATSTTTLSNTQLSTFTSTVRTYLSLSPPLRKKKKSHDIHRSRFDPLSHTRVFVKRERD